MKFPKSQSIAPGRKVPRLAAKMQNSYRIKQLRSRGLPGLKVQVMICWHHVPQRQRQVTLCKVQFGTLQSSSMKLVMRERQVESTSQSARGPVAYEPFVDAIFAPAAGQAGSGAEALIHICVCCAKSSPGCPFFLRCALCDALRRSFFHNRWLSF